MGSLLALQGPALLAEALCTCVAAGCWRFHSSFHRFHSWVAEGFISPGVFIPLVLRGLFCWGNGLGASSFAVSPPVLHLAACLVLVHRRSTFASLQPE